MYSSEQLLIRPAVKEDTDKMLEIYTPYIFKTPITFEYDVPSSKIFQQRIMKIEEKYPVLVILRAVSYRHLDVYKRQIYNHRLNFFRH